MLKKFFQSQFGPKKKGATDVRRKLSLLYAFLGWNCFGVAFYVMMKDKIPNDPVERRKALSNLTGSSAHMHVYRMSGLSLTEEFNVTHKRINKQKEKKAAEEKESETTKKE